VSNIRDWNMMTWKKASGTGAIIAAWSGLILAVASWMIACSIQSGSITIDNLGKNETMLTGNLVAILSSGLIHLVYSVIFPQDFDFEELDANIKLVEEDDSGLTAEDKDPEMLAESYKWITTRGWLLTIVLVIIWPLLSIPAGKFTKDYFAFWVLIAIAWGFGAAIVITFLPLLESSAELGTVIKGMFGMGGKSEEYVEKKEEVDGDKFTEA